MKRFLVTILTVTVFLQGTSMLWVVGAFYLNRQYIAEYFCINRDKPITMCYGSCYLEKQLKEEQEKEQQLPNLKLKEVTLFCDVRELKEPPLIQVDIPAARAVYHPDFYHFEYSASVFHPPAVS